MEPNRFTRAYYRLSEVEPDRVHALPDGAIYHHFLQGDWLFRHPIYKQWEYLGITQAALDEGMSNINFPHVKAFVDSLGPMTWALRRGDKEEYVEDDTGIFRFNASYCMVFAKYIATHGTLPTPDVFWKVWQKWNQEAMEHNLSVSSLTRTGVAHTPLEHLLWKSAFEGDALSVEDAKERIRIAAEHRCKRAAGGLIREMYTLYSLTVSDGEEKHQQPMRVWWHPFVDLIGKADALVIGPEKYMGIIGLAIYLKGPRSDNHSHRKFDNIPPSFKDRLYNLVSAPLEAHGQDNRDGLLLLPSKQDISRMRLALSGNIANSEGVYNGRNPRFYGAA